VCIPFQNLQSNYHRSQLGISKMFLHLLGLLIDRLPPQVHVLNLIVSSSQATTDSYQHDKSTNPFCWLCSKKAKMYDIFSTEQ
jgi:hypothetical protein